MKKEKRDEFWLLNDLNPLIPDGPRSSLTVGWACLCQWCWYAHWTGSCCDDGDLECEHPLLRKNDTLWEPYDVWESSDCWAFRPRFRREDCVDVVGIWLQGKYVDWDSVPDLKKVPVEMSFRVKCVKDFLITHGFVYTVRGKNVHYPITDQVDRSSAVEVMGVGKCKAKMVSPTPVTIPGILEHHGYVAYSGFDSIEEWWKAIESFHAVGGYLWRVDREPI